MVTRGSLRGDTGRAVDRPSGCACDPFAVKAVRALAVRLARLDDAPADERHDSRWLRASLRIHLASLRDAALGDSSAAADTLAVAIHELGPLPALAEPLFALFERIQRFGAARVLCREAARHAEHPGLRARWQRRLGDVCVCDGDDPAAVRAYEAALAAQPADPATVERCANALGRLGRHEDRAALLEARLAQASSHEELVLRRELAELCAGPLGRASDAAIHARRARTLALACDDDARSPVTTTQRTTVASDQPGYAPAVTRLPIAREMSPTEETIRKARACVAAAEAELHMLRGEDDLLDARRATLHTTLSGLFGDHLDAPDLAVAHARAAFDTSRRGSPGESAACARNFLDRLRSADATLELERVLADGAGPSDGTERIRTLARLRAGALCDAVGAAEAWRACLDGTPHDREALRGLRDAATALQDWPLVAWTLEEELTLVPEGRAADAVARADMLVALGDVARDRLGSTTRAARAYASALEANPAATDALRGLEGVLASMDDWKGVLDLVLSALDFDRGAQPADRIRLLVRAAHIAAELLNDVPHARESLRAACAIGPLDAQGEALARELGVEEGTAVDLLPESDMRAPTEPPDPAPAIGLSPLADLHSHELTLESSRRAPDGVEIANSPDAEQAAGAPASRAGNTPATQSTPANFAEALDAARFLVARGDFAGARDWLAAWIAQHGARGDAAASDAYDGLASLMAGPFGEPAAAARMLDDAIARRPGDVRLRGRLADLLLRVPGRHDEAILRHRELLAHQPARRRSIEALHRLAALRGVTSAEADARATLHALGIGADGPMCDRIATPIPIAHGLEQPVWERLRRGLAGVKNVLARVLDTPETSMRPLPGDARARFREWSLRVEGELASPALVPLDDATLGVVVRLVVDMAFERECVTGEGRLVNRLAHEFGWRSRSQLRRTLAPFTADEIADVDVAAWRRELRALAHAEALARTGGDLRTALLVLAEDDGALAVTTFGAPDLLAAVCSSPAASALLRRVCLAWSGTL